MSQEKFEPIDGPMFVQGYRSPFSGKFIIQRLQRSPRFSPSHEVHGLRTNPKTGKTQTRWIEPDSVWGRSFADYPKHGRVNAIRVIDHAPHQEALRNLDKERESLRQRIRDLDASEAHLLDEVFKWGLPVRVADLKAGKYLTVEERLLKGIPLKTVVPGKAPAPAGTLSAGSPEGSGRPDGAPEAPPGS